MVEKYGSKTHFLKAKPQIIQKENNVLPFLLADQLVQVFQMSQTFPGKKLEIFILHTVEMKIYESCRLFIGQVRYLKIQT